MSEATGSLHHDGGGILSGVTKTPSGAKTFLVNIFTSSPPPAFSGTCTAKSSGTDIWTLDGEAKLDSSSCLESDTVTLNITQEWGYVMIKGHLPEPVVRYGRFSGDAYWDT
jgi:hypothetical protein